MAEAPARRRLRWKPLLLIGLFVGAIVLVIGWHRAASSPGFCASCHDMRPAVETAAKSTHADVPCLACHSRPGAVGTLRYVPTLAREGLSTLTGWHLAEGILRPATCDRCHADVGAIQGENRATHPPPDSTCASCHGDVAHPGVKAERARQETHPAGYVQTHGAEVAENPGSCADCHEQRFCTACHFKSTYPHPKGWIEIHGAEQRAEGAKACALCHPQTFCVGCHGTEIPHASDWLGEHYRALQGTTTSPCEVCHAPRDCTDCHVRHDVHREQNLYG